ncbi:hypothetical protein LC087_19460 (plasmid) [Bacillus carboniphilus]|uniref:Uncharacterized protein n=1 Tax=Bacillus carboniphilus TaxID=86663 RepID=A0ABY9JYL2_9BACI|nr:hypothetical protein [Bacillus carboniphilus]WLR44481.1 hypothetical protein LC087_19460 [Bacillus carboniphilus]
MKIQKVTLKDAVTQETSDGFEIIYKNEKTFPCFITNYALKRGRETGLIESSLLSDLVRLQGIERLSTNKNVNPNDVDIDENKILATIYLGFLGGNPNTNYSFDDFLERYHDTYESSLNLYFNLITSQFGKNKFVEGFEKSTDRSRKNGKKSESQK